MRRVSAVLSTAAVPPSPWRRATPALLLAMAAVLLLYRDSFGAMVAIWSRSGTFAHAFLVPPISLWLIWRRRDALALLTPRAQLWMLLPLAVVAAVWLVGDLAGVNALTQLAATAMLVLTVPALLGLPVARSLTFPLAFLFFMVPLGEFLMPQLMSWTADITVSALRAFGVPVYREGLSFVIPSGSWSVIEACSGIRYLIASFMVGTLFAYLNFRSTRRRVLFGLVALAVPVVANWVRAVLIVMLGHLSNNRLAAGVDHLIYGWVFFGIVVMLMFFIGARWSEAPAADLAPQPRAGERASTAWVPWLAAACVVGLLALPRAAAWDLQNRSVGMPQLVMPQLPGVPLVADAQPLHRPLFEGPKAEAAAVYGSGDSAVTVHVAYYRQQTYGHKLVNSQNMLVRSEDPDWHLTASGVLPLKIGSLPVEVRTAELRQGDLSDGRGRRLQVRQVYWIDGRFTINDTWAGLLGLAARLNGDGDDGAAITFYRAGEQADPALDRFVETHLDGLGQWLAGVRALR
jgi:exosortase A